MYFEECSSVNNTFQISLSAIRDVIWIRKCVCFRTQDRSRDLTALVASITKHTCVTMFVAEQQNVPKLSSVIMLGSK